MESASTLPNGEDFARWMVAAAAVAAAVDAVSGVVMS
jgi:hypothetical protein